MKSLLCLFLLVEGCCVITGLTREYVFIDFVSVWESAQSHCRTYYKDLATISSLEEKLSFVQAASGVGNWIGLKRTSGNWEWSDGEQYSFLNWFNGKPYYSNAGYDCGSTSSYYPEFWVNYDCSNNRKFICYRFLILVKEKKTWEEAQEFCRTNYTGLASVTSQSSLRQLKLETVGTQTENVWTGLNFIDGTWLWVSGEPLGNQVSIPPQCPARPYRCGSLNTTSNTFNKQNCNDKLNFVCYWN